MAQVYIYFHTLILLKEVKRNPKKKGGGGNGPKHTLPVVRRYH